MERARKVANRAILKRLVNESKQSRNGEMSSRSPVSYTPSRYVSSLSPFGSKNHSRSDSLGARKCVEQCWFWCWVTIRSISVEALKSSDTFPRRHNSATPEEQPRWLSHVDLESKNKIFKSFIGMGYYNTHNPAWYTQYTPYQAEISQGRLESLLNFQTMITDLTGLPMSNASLLDEGTAAAEAMAMCNNIVKGKKKTFIIANNCHPQTIDICKTRADGFDLKVVTADLKDIDYSSGDVCGVLVQYPGTEGEILDYGEFIKNAHAQGVKVVMATDLLALIMLKPPGELGADIVVGSAQRFGVPMGYEYKRMMPGRIIGVSVDSSGKPALRMAMQTREQHIRRDKATSNICTAQALLANMAAMYAVYHGPEGLKTIAQRVHGLAGAFAVGLKKLGNIEVQGLPFFDTVKVTCADAHAIADAAYKSEINLRVVDAKTITVSFDETTTLDDLDKLFKVFAGGKPVSFTAASLAPEVGNAIPSGLLRQSSYLTHQIFNTYHTEHELLRYLHKLQSKDLSLCHSMIPLDLEMFNNLGDLLCTITGFDSFSLQPNAGAAGEYAGLMVIRAYHKSRGDHHRNVCIIPVSAHGTNPASAAMCGMKIVPVGTDSKGNINIEELRKAAEANRDKLSALMVTYPSTHGVYEEGIDEICRIIHDNGGQVGLTSPGFIGADVCHLNLHKTFCIPHGGGGPGMGPIGVKKHLAPFLPSHPVVSTGGIPAPDKSHPLGTISAAPWGSALILPISYTYIAMMGSKGLTDASKIAILNANYMAKRLENYYHPVLFRGVNGTVAHEFIVDLRGFKNTAGIEPEDVAKRLMDYGFHAPTMSWPVPGTLMIEPTESESKAELDRFCDALISIREEIAQIENGKADIHNNVLKGAPHPPSLLMGDAWTKPYTREYAAFPASWLRTAKFWPTTGDVLTMYMVIATSFATLLPVSQMVEEEAAANA
ncbi:hypothetical protein ES332_A05G046500v1 [Gossypium tomentosum]|uniref:glycine dehydrogenase (aminomethyl-transferring) n=1 Tax=Gossypium tomentosum TaxID=34277 RepID=A0A5D2QDM2_GOSTO|nr:hypothetical protein ES332_A05G046500v1 [Gossypium tomentosum]